MKIGKKLLSQRQDIFVSYDHMEDERTKTTVLKLYRSIIVNLLSLHVIIAIIFIFQSLF